MRSEGFIRADLATDVSIFGYVLGNQFSRNLGTSFRLLVLLLNIGRVQISTVLCFLGQQTSFEDYSQLLEARTSETQSARPEDHRRLVFSTWKSHVFSRCKGENRRAIGGKKSQVQNPLKGQPVRHREKQGWMRQKIEGPMDVKGVGAGYSESSL